MSQLNTHALEEYICQQYDASVIPSLKTYIQIDNLSRTYDKQWNSNGKLTKAADHIVQWVRSLNVEGLTTEVIKDQEYSPIIFTEIKGHLKQTLFFYGHFDKQPHGEGWNQHLGYGPTKPKIVDGKLYGRGGADDGYSTYSTILAIKALQEQGIKIPRCVMLTEGDEESGSAHMTHYLKKLKQRIGEPSIFFCLDSGTLDYERFWMTTSLRGNLVATLKVSTHKEPIHSGDSSGVIPSCFRIARSLLNRIENFETGEINQKFHSNISPIRYQENVELAQEKGDLVMKQFCFLAGVKPLSDNPLNCLLQRNWHPSFTVIGQTGFPEAKGAGNSLLPSIQLKFSLRLPPNFAYHKAVQILHQVLLTNVPYNAHAELKNIRCGGGWSSQPYEPYFEEALTEASQTFYKQKKLALGQGGSIPLITELDQLWPGRQFLITGVLGPHSNAHGPNQFLHIDYVKKLTCCLAFVVAKSAQHYQKIECQ